MGGMEDGIMEMEWVRRERREGEAYSSLRFNYTGTVCCT